MDFGSDPKYSCIFFSSHYSSEDIDRCNCLLSLRLKPQDCRHTSWFFGMHLGSTDCPSVLVWEGAEAGAGREENLHSTLSLQGAPVRILSPSEIQYKDFSGLELKVNNSTVLTTCSRHVYAGITSPKNVIYPLL